MAQLIHPEVIGKPFFPSVKRELTRRKSLNQISYGSPEVSNPHLWQPYFVMRRIKRNNSQDLSVAPNEYLEGRFSKIGKIVDNDYDISEGVKDIKIRGGEFRPSAGVVQANIIQDGFTFFTINVDFAIPNIEDFNDFKKMWFVYSAPCEIEFGRIVPVQFNITGVDASPYIQKFNALVATFSYSVGNSGRTVTGNLKLYTAVNMFPLAEASASEKRKVEFQGHVLDRIKGDQILYGKPTKTDKQEVDTLNKDLEKRENRDGDQSQRRAQEIFDPFFEEPENPIADVETTPDGYYIGVVTALEESSYRPDAISPRFDGKQNYGAFQFYHTNAKTFIDQTPHKSKFEGLDPSTDEFNTKWKEVSAEDPDAFFALQYAHAYKVFYKPIESSAKSKGINTEDRGIAEFLFGLGINHSPNGYNKIMDNAINSSGSNPSATEFIDQLKIARINYVNNLPDTTEGGALSDKLVARYEREATIAKKLSNNEDVATELGGGSAFTQPKSNETNFSDNPFRADTRSVLDSSQAELVYVPVNTTTIRDKSLEWGQLQENSGAFTDDSGNKRSDTRHGTQPLPEGYVQVKDFIDAKANIAEVIESLLATLKLDSNIFGTDLYYYVSVFALEQMINEYLNKFYEAGANATNPLIRIDLSSVKIRDLSTLGIPMTSIFPESILFNPHKLEGEDNENMLKTVYVSAQYIYDLTIEREIASPFLFIEAVINKINESTMGVINLQKMNKVTINNDDNHYDANVLTYVDHSIIVDSFTNENDAYYEFELFSAKEKVKNPNVETEMSDIFAQIAFASHYRNAPIHNRIIRDEKNEAGIWWNEGGDSGNDADGGGAPTYVAETDEQAREGASDAPNKVNDLQNNEEEAIRRRTWEVSLDVARGQVESILSKSTSSYSLDNETNESYQETISRVFATVHFLFDLTLAKMHLNTDRDTGTGIPIPLKYTFTIDGMAGIVQGQCFRISPDAFPISYTIGEDHDTYTYVVLGVNHEFTGNTWDTTLNGILYFSQAGITSMLSGKSKEEIKQAKLGIEAEANQVILNNFTHSNVEQPKLEPIFSQPVKADMDKFKIDSAITDKKNSITSLKNSISQAQADFASGKESLEYNQKKIGGLQSMLDKAQGELSVLQNVKAQIENNIYDLDSFITNATESQIPKPLDVVNQTEYLKNGMLSQVNMQGDLSIASNVQEIVHDSSKVGTSADSTLLAIQSISSSGENTGEQVVRMESLEEGLKNISMNSKMVASLMDSNSSGIPNTEAMEQASLLSKETTNELVGLKNLAPSTGITNVPIGNEIVPLDVALNSMMEQNLKVQNTIQSTVSLVNPETGKLMLDTPMALEYYKTADLSTVPDGFIAGIRRQESIKQSKMSFRKASRILGY